MQITRSATITATAALTVSVNVPSRGYAGSSFAAQIILSGDLIGPFRYVINWGDGGQDVDEPAPSPYVATHVYATAGSYTIDVTATDLGTGGIAYGSASTIIAADLTASLTANPTFGNAPLAVTLSFSFGGGFPSYNWSLAYGDGGSDSGTSSVAASLTRARTYMAGTYTAVLTVTDNIGGISVAEVAITTGGLAQILIPFALGAAIIAATRGFGR